MSKRCSAFLAALILTLSVGRVRGEDAAVRIKAFVGAGPGEVLPLLYLQKQDPRRFQVDLSYWEPVEEATGRWIGPKSDAQLAEHLQMRYIQNRFPEKFADYVECTQFDPTMASCAPLLGIDLSSFNPKDGALLAQVKEGAAQAWKLGVRKPLPAVFIEGKPYVHTLLLAELLPHLNSLLPQGRRIAGVPGPKDVFPAIKMYVLGLPKGVGAREPYWERQMLQNLPGLEIAPLDPGSEEGKAFMQKLDAKALPVYFFDKSIEQQADILSGMQGRGLVVEKNGYYPIDRKGPRELLHRQASPDELTLFVMSQCPYGVQAENAVFDTLKLKRLPPTFKLNVRFIVSQGKSEKGASAWQSMHGQAELDEDVRQVVIQKYFPEKFLAYLEVRNADYRSDKWEAAAQKAGLDPASIKARLKEGEGLLENDWKDTTALGIGASPTFLWENRYLLASGSDLKMFVGVDPYKATQKPGEADAAPAASCQ